ncbi:MAG: PIG-L family deacetylase, partial [Chloroflexota bacterium]|nr:PIG-L family deacetylase [Chloroflexota bacterium]
RGWAIGFLLAGMLLRPRVKYVVPTGSQRVLVVAPHPDDETLACGGTMARHVAAGGRVCVLVVTDGGSSRAGGIARGEMRRLRQIEAKAAMQVLGGVDLVQSGLPEGRWSPGDLQPCLEALLRPELPAIVYAPSCVDFHPEHIKVASALAQALRALGGVTRPKIRVYELQVPLTPVLANVAVEVGGAAAVAKEQALARYRTQQSSFDWVPRHGRYLRALYRTRAPVEVFWEMHAESYCRLMELHARRGIYRSMRPRPFGDGLSWLMGLTERQRLKKLVRGQGVG